MLSYNYFSSEFNMQKKNYQQFQDERETEMHNYPTGIPVGQPVVVNPYPHPQQYPAEQYHPQPYYAQPPMQPHPQPQIHFVPQGMMLPPPPMPQQMAQNYSFPIQVQCPCCKMNVPTVVNHQSGNTTYMWCAFLLCCVSPFCSCVPFLMDSCLDKTHYCPNCGHNILRKHQKCFDFINC